MLMSWRYTSREPLSAFCACPIRDTLVFHWGHSSQDQGPATRCMQTATIWQSQTDSLAMAL